MVEIERIGGMVVQDTTSGLLTVNDEFTVSIGIARCRETLAGARRWHIRFDTGLDPDVTVAVRMAPSNHAPLDYFLLPRIDMAMSHLRLAEHNGVSLDAYRFETLARALNVNVDAIRRKRKLLDGICPEAAELLKDKHVPINAFAEIKKMAPFRQIEAAELMVAMNKYTINYAKSLFAATPQDQLSAGHKRKNVKGLTDEQVALMERESASLEREFKIAEQSYGTDHLDLVLTRGFLVKVLGNARVVRYLAQHHQGILSEFQKIAELDRSAA